MSNSIEKDQYARMTKTPIFKLVLELGLPTTVSMLITNLYNMADTWFVGRLGTSATGAVGVIFGLMAIIQAFGFMFGHGSGSNISRFLGAHKEKEASVFSSTGFFMSVIAGILITIFGIVFLNPLCRLLGSTDTILPYARAYALFILLEAPAMAGSCVLNNILRYEGYATFAMIGLVSGSVINIGGDAFFMNVIGMGIEGAGLSTFISQYVSFFILLSMFLRGRTQSHLSIKLISRSVSDVMNIIETGFPAVIRQGLGSISIMVLNGQAAAFGDAAIAAMSVVSRVSNFIFSIALGIGQGFQPVSSFNYGAGLYSRVRKGFWFTLFMSIGMLSVFAGICAGSSRLIVGALLHEDAAIVIADKALRIQCAAIPFLPLCVCGNMMFQSLGYAGRSSILSLFRSGIFFIPLVIILPVFFQLDGIIVAQPAADVISGIISAPIILTFLRKLPGKDKALR